MCRKQRNCRIAGAPPEELASAVITRSLSDEVISPANTGIAASPRLLLKNFRFCHCEEPQRRSSLVLRNIEIAASLGLLLKNFRFCHCEKPQRRSGLVLRNIEIAASLWLLAMTAISSSLIRACAAGGTARNDNFLH